MILTGYSHYLQFGEEIPEIIIVGISYGTNDWQQGNARSEDYTVPSAERPFWGGAPQFHSVLRNEIIPCVESNFASDPSRRILFGHSIGGQFVLYSALNHPGYFWGHIASNPALHRNLEYFMPDKWNSIEQVQVSSLFVGIAENDEQRFRKPAMEWVRAWRQQSRLPWFLKQMTMDAHNHMSSVPAAFRNGMIWQFESK